MRVLGVSTGDMVASREVSQKSPLLYYLTFLHLNQFLKTIKETPKPVSEDWSSEICHLHITLTFIAVT